MTLAATLVAADGLPAPEAVLRPLLRANDHYLQAVPDPGAPIVGRKVWPGNIWTRAVYLEGLLALHERTGDPRLLDWAHRWAEAHRWGLRKGPLTRNADDQACGQAYLHLYRRDPRPERLADLRLAIAAMRDSDRSDDWTWIDALQMAMPVFAGLGTTDQDPRLWERMHDLYRHTRDREGGRGLFSADHGLWWRDRDFLPPMTTPGGRPCFWSRGNGWVVAALVRTLQELPASAPHRDEYAAMLTTMCRALLPLQRPDGFWNVSLMDPTDHGGPELTGTALFVYGMAWGQRTGLLPADEFQPALLRAWDAIVREGIMDDGRLAWVQGTGKQPSDGQPVTRDSRPDFDDFGLGCLLLAGTEVHRLACGPGSKP